MLGMAMTPVRPQGRGSADGHRFGFVRWYMFVDVDGLKVAREVTWLGVVEQ